MSILIPCISAVAISSLELACTDQVYLLIIAFVASQNNMRQAAVVYLILYNIMFIPPPIAIFVVAYKGITSQKLSSLAGRHVAPAKLAIAVLFICMRNKLQTR